MKSTFLSLALLISTISFSAHANQNYICYAKAIEIQESASNLSVLFERGERILINFIARKDEALIYSLTLGSGNRPPNDNLMSMINDASDILTNNLKQNLSTTTMLVQNVNFSKFKTDFNNCLTEELKLKCPNAIANFNNSISSVILNHQEMIDQHKKLSIANTHVLSVLKNDYENKVAMTPDKYQELSQTTAPSQFYYKKALNTAQSDTKAIASLIKNELVECFLK